MATKYNMTPFRLEKKARGLEIKREGLLRAGKLTEARLLDTELNDMWQEVARLNRINQINK